MSTPSFEADLMVVGAGPAGVAAAVMAASLRLRTVIVEAGPVGGKLHTIDALENVSGNWSTGRELANALAADLSRLQQSGGCTVVQARAVEVSSYDDRVELTLQDGRLLTAQAIVVATGVATQIPADVSWVSSPAQFAAPPLWRTTPEDLPGQTYVLGGDRQIGTWLRAHPKASTTLHVLCPPTDDYKMTEVSGDERVRLVPVSHVTLSRSARGGSWTIEVKGRQGQEKSYLAQTVLSNLGNKPAALKGLSQGEDGYCPSTLQRPRIRVAGDLRSARYQRIATAQGSGAEAVLAYYYATALPKA